MSCPWPPSTTRSSAALIVLPRARGSKATAGGRRARGSVRPTDLHQYGARLRALPVNARRSFDRLRVTFGDARRDDFLDLPLIPCTDSLGDGNSRRCAPQSDQVIPLATRTPDRVKHLGESDQAMVSILRTLLDDLPRVLSNLIERRGSVSIHLCSVGP